MNYNIYCLLKTENKDRVIRVKIIADCIADAIQKAKQRFNERLKEKKFSIFMYETAK